MVESKRGGEAVAIIGMALRLPGDISDESALWDALKEGRDLVSSVPSERWGTQRLLHPQRGEPGRSVTFSAGVLTKIDQFDAGFHGISPREAAWLDPQQRLLLELAWEAMENGGQVPSTLAGSNTAVFVGISGVDYGMRGLHDLASMTSHSMTGNTLSIAANRLSYAFDLRGPSLAVDTACSSSLVALHQACQSLHSGECTQALVGGVNMLLHPYPFVGFTKAAMISARGRSRPFDASADGYVRAEGGIVLLLKPLQRALHDGDSIEAVILASGINSDGRRKTGITIPSSAGQAELMRQVLDRAGITASEVAYVEAHGTGTPVGDPLEAHAIGEVYGKERATPIPIGSIKSNLGHLEPASGLAGLAKTLVMLKQRTLVPTIHVHELSPRIDFDALNLCVSQRVSPFESAPDRPLRMAVSSFGFGGTNAHVILQEAPPIEMPCEHDGKWSDVPLVLSARSPEALRALAGRYAQLLDHADERTAYDIAYGAAHNRELMEKRLWIRGSTPSTTARVLGAYASGDAPREIQHEDVLAEPAKTAFVYSGNGSQWDGMGRRLLAASAEFAATIEELDALIAPSAGFSIAAVLKGNIASRTLDDTAVAQPLLFAVQVGITQMLARRGIAPDAVAGHSVGEIAAAWAAGALTLQQAAEVIVARSAAQALTRATGRMAALGLSEADAREALQAAGCTALEIAGVNSPTSVTVAGRTLDLHALKTWSDANGIFFRQLDLDYAFHSRCMDPLQQRIEATLAKLAPATATTPFVSTVSGEVLDGRALTAAYWWNNVREPVRFEQAVRTLAAEGCRVFLEIGPNPILQRYIRETLTTVGTPSKVASTLRRDDDGESRVEAAAMSVHLSQRRPRLGALFAVAGNRVRLPNYPWQRERHWHPHSNEPAEAIDRCRVHPLLGWRIGALEGAWENTLDPALYPYLADHRVAGAITLPAAAYAEVALAAAHDRFGGERFEVEQLEILAPIVFDADRSRSLRFDLVDADGTFRMRSRPRLSDDPWIINAVGRLVAQPSAPAPQAACDDLGGDAICAAQHYALTDILGLEYGPAFRTFVDGTRRGSEIFGRIALNRDAGCTDDGFFMHPARLDACFQALVNTFRDEIEAGHGQPLLPVKIGRLSIFSRVPVGRFHARVTRRNLRSVVAEFTLMGDSGEVVASLEGCRFRAANFHRPANARPRQWRTTAKLLHGVLQDPRSSPTRRCSRWTREARQCVAQEEFVDARRQSYFSETRPLLDALVIAYAHNAFIEWRRVDPDGFQHGLTDAETMGSPLRAYVRWLAHQLQQAQLLRSEAGEWKIDGADGPLPDEIWRTIVSDTPQMLPELLLVGRIGRNLAGILSGAVPPLDLRDSIRRSALSEALLTDSPTYLGIHRAMDAWLAAAVRDWPSNRRLRILEVSRAGTDLPQHLRTVLPAERVDYVIGSLDETQTEKLEGQYRGHAFVTVAKLSEDLNDLTAERALPSQFDLVIVHHCLHAQRNLRAALVGLRRHLADDAVMAICERAADLPADFVHGLDPDWWFDSEDGPVSSLQQPSAWARILEEQGFIDLETLVEESEEDLVTGCFMVTARNSATPATLPQRSTASWLLLTASDRRSLVFAKRVALHLESQAQRVVVTSVAVPNDETAPQAAAPALETILGAAKQVLGAIDHIVYFGDRGEDAELTVLSREDLAQSDAAHFLRLLQALTSNDAPRRLWLITSGGALVSQPRDGWLVRPASAPLWGLARVGMNEHPELQCTSIDLATPMDDASTVERLVHEMLDPDGECEIVLDADGRYGVRVEAQDEGSAPADDGERRYRLDFRTPGQLHNLVWTAEATPALDDQEIEVRCAATGLNFRDVMYAMGLLPDEIVENGFAGATLGLEFAGTVTRVGPRVSGFRAGDEVMGFGRACMASHAITRASALMVKPENWSFEEAATVPAVFFTAYYALKHLANLQEGERVLIHGAAGGVGIAAVQIARHLGAEIYATAGSDEKRDFLRLLGVEHVFDSRRLTFADEILALTGDGVDVVLNSLAGEAINRNLRALRAFGRFIELGKRDYVENTHVGLRGFSRNISYFAVDADAMLDARPQLSAQLFREITDLFREGVLFPLPHRVFPAARAVEAFRYMQQSRQIGKVVIATDSCDIVARPTESSAARLRFASDATYIVTGGLEGFGRETARWLAERGAGTIVLVGRRGMRTPGAAQTISELEGIGATVHVVACDVADRAALTKVFSRIDRELPPLRGIVHAAAAIEDGLIASLETRRFEDVMLPKALGALNLHALSLNHPLDYFILYSSVSATIGNPGQSAYVAANALLESVAAWRRLRGLPATCIAWGPIGDAGYLSRNTTVREGLASRLGATALNSAQALATLERLLVEDGSNRVVADFDVMELARALPTVRGPLFEALRWADGRTASSDAPITDIRGLLAGKSEDEARELLVAMMVQEVAQILSIDARRIDPKRSLLDFGMDSLMAVELALGIEKRFGVRLPAMAIGDGLTVERVAARLVALLGRDGDDARMDEVDELVKQMAAQHAEIVSEEEMEQAIAHVKVESRSGTRLIP